LGKNLNRRQAGGTFTGSGTQSNGKIDSSISGAFSFSANGILMTLNGKPEAPLCQIDSGNNILVCTYTTGDGSSALSVATKQAASYSLADAAGNSLGNFLISGATSGEWETNSVTVNPDGTFTETTSRDGGTPRPGSGQIAISPTGVLTCPSGSCLDPTFQGFVDAGKSVGVTTSGASPTSPNPNNAILWIFTKQAESYSEADLPGVYQGNTLEAGPNAPYWEMSTLTINPDRTYSRSFTGSDGSTGTTTGAFSISSAGIISCVSGDCFGDDQTFVMGADKTGIVSTSGLPPVDATSAPGLLGGDAKITIFTKNAPVPAVLGAPTGVTATPGNTEATVSFTAPASNGGSPITGYTVTSNPAGGVDENAGTTSTTHTAKSLKNGTAYTFTVTATNANGTGPASSPSNSVTPGVVPGAPTNVTAKGGNGRATVSFKLPANGGSPITVCTAASKPGGITGTGAGSPITVTGLTNGTAYTFTVTATNEIGTGPASKPSGKVTPVGAPGAPTGVTAKAGHDQATVSFKAPASNGGSAITGYTVTSSLRQIAKGHASPITVKGLKNGTTYTFTVTATNKAGTGQASIASSPVTPQ
jgi:predicted RNA-binding protein with TRAM domain